MPRKTLAALCAGLCSLPAQAQLPHLLDAIVVTATRVPLPDVTAPYASEVHTRAMIEASGASSLFDYLRQHTSVHVQPAYGNPFTPKLDMRGYGIGDGYQNIVVSLDGRRLNNIDMTAQLLGAIPLADIERIEITKGSGSVLFGDGATAGSIQIISRPHAGVSLAAGAGNYGWRAGSATAGLNRERLRLSVSATDERGAGYSKADVTGHKDAASNRVWRGALEARPIEVLDIGLDLASARIDTRYPGPLSLAEFKADPANNGGNIYNHQKLETDLWRVRFGLDLAPGWRLTLAHGQEDKLSDFRAPWPFKSTYDYATDELALQYQGGAWAVEAGWQRFDGVRVSRNGFGDNDTRKDNRGGYLQAHYQWADTTVSAGARRERVDYSYKPTLGAGNRANERLTAWNLGVNQRLDAQLSLFASLDRAFQAPDIDRFFTFGGGFNGFIDPATSRTLSVGLNHVTPTNRLKLSLFRANLENEIYYLDTGNFLTSYNTNLDKTHKYGLELQNSWRASEALTVLFNYTYSRAIIDREADGGGAFNGKDLPGVPRHGVVVGFNWRPASAWDVNLTHGWRSKTYAVEDFANSYAQRQAAYRATDLSLRYRVKNLEWSASVDNLFKDANGLWVRDDVIYPVNFTRNVRVSLKATF